MEKVFNVVINSSLDDSQIDDLFNKFASGFLRTTGAHDGLFIYEVDPTDDNAVVRLIEKIEFIPA